MQQAAAAKRTIARSEARGTDAGASEPDLALRAPLDLRRLVDGLLRQLESDRARVTHLLGDEVLSVLTMARYLVEDAARCMALGELEQPSESLEAASARIRDATHQLTALCLELRPRALDDLGVRAALSSYFREFERENRAIFLSPRITVRESDVPVDLKLIVFRIVQAALSNVARHSRASAARVYLSRLEDELRLGVEDDGLGFDAERWRNRRAGNDGCGLGMILRWAETSGGQCSIQTTPRHGVRVQVVWRLQPAAAGQVLQAGESAS